MAAKQTKPTPAVPVKQLRTRKLASHNAGRKKRTTAKRTSGETCFVLMPFKEPFDTYYAAIIRPAVEASGLIAVRGDSIFRSSPIMGDIWQMIQDAQILIAEMTEKNANVFYELGLAHAIGKPVILVAETIADVPFDLQALRVILYDKNNPEWGRKLRANVTRYIKETRDDTASAVPPMFRKVVKSQAPAEPELVARVSALERQVGSVRAMFGPMVPTPDEIRRMELEDLERHIRYASTRAEVVEFVAQVLYHRKNLADLLEMVLQSHFPSSEAKRILRDSARRRV
jgi:hypothetical protein